MGTKGVGFELRRKEHVVRDTFRSNSFVIKYFVPGLAVAFKELRERHTQSHR